MNKYSIHTERYEVSQELFSILSNIFLNADCDIHKFRFRHVHKLSETLKTLFLDISVWQYVYVDKQQDEIYSNEFKKLHNYLIGLKFENVIVEPISIEFDDGLYRRQIDFKILVDKENSLAKIPYNERSSNERIYSNIMCRQIGY